MVDRGNSLLISLLKLNILGIHGKKKRKKEKYNSYKGEIGKVADNLLNRDFSAERAFEKLATDVTQFNVRVQKGNYEKIIASKQLFSMR